MCKLQANANSFHVINDGVLPFSIYAELSFESQTDFWRQNDLGPNPSSTGVYFFFKSSSSK